MESEIFLAVDADSIASYIDTDSSDDNNHPSENGGFVLAIDAFFDPTKLDERQKVESPGFTGVLRVLGSLVRSDLYAMCVAETQESTDLWPLAMHHPRQVYVGPAVKLQREKWKESKESNSQS